MESKKFLALGSATSLWTDIDGALALSDFDGVVAANEAGVLWAGELTSWVTLHPEEIEGRIDRRRSRGYPDAKEICSHFTKRETGAITLQIEYMLPRQKKSGSSGLFAVKRCLDLGATHVVCCGIPMEKTMGRVDGKEQWPSASMFRGAWENVVPVIRHKVRSMSGWTRNLLGAPTAEWFNQVGSLCEPKPGEPRKRGS